MSHTPRKNRPDPSRPDLVLLEEMRALSSKHARARRREAGDAEGSYDPDISDYIERDLRSAERARAAAMAALVQRWRAAGGVLTEAEVRCFPVVWQPLLRAPAPT